MDIVRIKLAEKRKSEQLQMRGDGLYMIGQ